MTTLHVRSIPDELYSRIQRLAQKRSRSLSAQVVTLLYDAVDEAERRLEQASALDSIRRRRFVTSPSGDHSLDLLREDRNR
jgi:plasmid stability protein